MNIDKMISAINDCSGEELERINEVLQNARLNQYRKQYDHIASYIGDAFQQAGEAGFGIVISDSYDNSVTIYPTELAKESFTIEVYHKVDKERCLELDLEAPDEE